MQPTDNQKDTPVVPQRNSYLHVDPRPVDDTGVQTNSQNDATKSAAAQVVRGQIGAIYQSDPYATTPATGPQNPHGAVAFTPETAANPYNRTHNEQQHQINQHAWQKYHSAWQSYYQQYYERYYVGQVHQTKQALEQQISTKGAAMTESEAMYELRNDLIGKVRQHATKVRKSHHFWPIMSALGVMLVFVFLQYNRMVFATVSAYVSPGNVNPANIIVDIGDNSTVTKDDRLIIPKINVDVPIVWGANAADQNALNDAMTKGVVWFNIQQAHSRPGENGNFVLSGHSSNDWLDQGDYKFIFAPLEQMQVGDTFYVNYQQKRYVYKITKKEVVKPTDVGALATDNTKPVATLITCTPLGTALNRLLIVAEQISPNPSQASAPSTSNSTASQMPTNSPTFFERIFGIGN